jgi:hypothetical protein
LGNRMQSRVRRIECENFSDLSHGGMLGEALLGMKG